MATYFNPYENFPRNHFTITPSDTLPIATGECLVMAGAAGNISVEDDNGAIVIYTVAAGAILPLIVSKVRATGTTVAQVIGLR